MVANDQVTEWFPTVLTVMNIFIFGVKIPLHSDVERAP